MRSYVTGDSRKLPEAASVEASTPTSYVTRPGWRGMDPLARLMTRVVKTPDGHWLWTGSRCGLRREYGQLVLNGRRTGSHRAAWLLIRGPIPDGLDVLHHCDQSLCCNPDHLHLGTHAENLAEALAARSGRSWQPRGEAHPRARLTWAKVNAIREAYKAGASKADLAAQYSVTQTHIHHIVTGKRWLIGRAA